MGTVGKESNWILSSSETHSKECQTSLKQNSLPNDILYTSILLEICSNSTSSNWTSHLKYNSG